jgi:hypothetical protein
MNRRASWVLLLAVGVLVFVVSAMWWTDFLTSNLCHDAGGDIRNGECVGAMTAIPILWDATWQRIAVTLLPPGIVAVIVVAVIWTLKRSR